MPPLTSIYVRDTVKIRIERVRVRPVLSPWEACIDLCVRGVRMFDVADKTTPKRDLRDLNGRARIAVCRVICGDANRPMLLATVSPKV
jgi:hypothetical protein